MKIKMLFFISLLLFSNNLKSQDLQLEILIDDKPFKGKKTTLDSLAIVTLQLKNTKPDHQYYFSKISVQWILEKQRKTKKGFRARKFLGMARTFPVDPSRSYITQTMKLKCDDCGRHDLALHIGRYDQPNKNANITFPFMKFYDPCLSRAVVRIDEITVIAPNGKKTVVRNFPYKKQISLYASWSSCDYYNYFNDRHVRWNH